MTKKTSSVGAMGTCIILAATAALAGCAGGDPEAEDAAALSRGTVGQGPRAPGTLTVMVEEPGAQFGGSAVLHTTYQPPPGETTALFDDASVTYWVAGHEVGTNPSSGGGVNHLISDAPARYHLALGHSYTITAVATLKSLATLAATGTLTVMPAKTYVNLGTDSKSYEGGYWLANYGKPITMSGTVYDGYYQPLPNVLLRGTWGPVTKLTWSNANGEYSYTVTPDESNAPMPANWSRFHGSDVNPVIYADADVNHLPSKYDLVKVKVCDPGQTLLRVCATWDGRTNSCWQYTDVVECVVDVK